MKISISKKREHLQSRYTTTQGYRNMASISNRMKIIADQVKLHAEAFARVAGGRDAAIRTACP